MANGCRAESETLRVMRGGDDDAASNEGCIAVVNATGRRGELEPGVIALLDQPGDEGIRWVEIAGTTTLLRAPR